MELEWQKKALDRQLELEENIKLFNSINTPRTITFAKLIWARHHQPDKVLELERAHCRARSTFIQVFGRNSCLGSTHQLVSPRPELQPGI